jgi:uncharacterized protein (TIGR02246 family)
MITRTIVTLAALALFAAFAAATAPAPAPDDDIAAIKKNTAAFQTAWNKHDAKALAAFWAKDGDLIDPWGVTSVGRDAVEKFFAEQHTGSGKLAKSTYDNKADAVRLITPDVALEDWQVALTGLSDPEGKPLGPQFHRVVIVSKKEAGQWRIAAARPGLPTDAAPAKPTKLIK